MQDIADGMICKVFLFRLSEHLSQQSMPFRFCASSCPLVMHFVDSSWTFFEVQPCDPVDDYVWISDISPALTWQAGEQSLQGQHEHVRGVREAKLFTDSFGSRCYFSSCAHGQTVVSFFVSQRSCVTASLAIPGEP
jgi:hypothetical protein